MLEGVWIDVRGGLNRKPTYVTSNTNIEIASISSYEGVGERAVGI